MYYLIRECDNKHYGITMECQKNIQENDVTLVRTKTVLIKLYQKTINNSKINT